MRPYVFRYWKPRGVLSTTSLTNGQKTISCSSEIMNITKGLKVEPIGRLDKDSEGLLLLTTDCSISDILLRPSYHITGSHIEKEYHVTTEKFLSDEHIRTLSEGIEIKIRNWNKPKDIIKTLPCLIERIGLKNKLKIILREGKNRQIRKMIGSCGHKVTNLRRVRFGSVDLVDMKVGEVKLLTEDQLLRLLELRSNKDESTPTTFTSAAAATNMSRDQ